MTRPNPTSITARRQAGFTAIDITIAMAVTGLMFAATINVTNEVVPRLRVKQAAMDVASAIRATRAKSILGHEISYMPIDVSDGRFVMVTRGGPGSSRTVRGADGTLKRVVNLPDGVEFTAPRGTYGHYYPVSVSPPTTLWPDRDYTDVALRGAAFNSRGMLESTTIPGYVHVGHPARGHYMRIKIDAAGNVSLEKWDGSDWVKS